MVAICHNPACHGHVTSNCVPTQLVQLPCGCVALNNQQKGHVSTAPSLPEFMSKQKTSPRRKKSPNLSTVTTGNSKHFDESQQLSPSHTRVSSASVFLETSPSNALTPRSHVSASSSRKPLTQSPARARIPQSPSSVRVSSPVSAVTSRENADRHKPRSRPRPPVASPLSVSSVGARRLFKTPPTLALQHFKILRKHFNRLTAPTRPYRHYELPTISELLACAHPSAFLLN